MQIETLKQRSEFLAMRRGVRWQAPVFVLLALRMGPETRAGSESPDSAANGVGAVGRGVERGPRFGFTVTRKLGCAVTRNRARRRLREAVRGLPEGLARPGFDYVLIARRGALERRFKALIEDLEIALGRVHEHMARRVGGRKAGQHKLGQRSKGRRPNGRQAKARRGPNRGA